jgi:hypothetical protein
LTNTKQEQPVSNKFIPSGDEALDAFAKAFAIKIAEDPSVYRVSQDDLSTLQRLQQAFHDALTAAWNRQTRSMQLTGLKESARAELEQHMRKLGRMIRANDDIDPVAKHVMRLGGAPIRARKQTCPNEPPQLTFVRVLHQGIGATPIHELRFGPADSSRKAKPQGAARIELFVDLIPPDEPIPTHPGANHGGRPWYLRSYTRSPIVITPPTARVPMRVVYWARWADPTGNVGPFSNAAAGYVEGGSVAAPRLPSFGAIPKPMIEVAPGTSQSRDSTYTVALIETHYLSLNAPVMPELKQIEDQTQVEAA